MAYTELNATATDAVDGELTDNIVIDSSAVNTDRVGDYSVTYDVTDTAGNAAEQKTRTVRVIDTGKPIITLTGDNPQTIEFGEGYTELNATATDLVDGDLTGSIVIDSSAVNTDRVGDYSVTYDVTDTAGNAAEQKTRTVRVIDAGKPIITLTGANPQTIEFGEGYTELNATATDRVDGDLTGNIVIDSSAVNINRVGDYSVTYNVTDTAKNPADTVTRTVRVTDTTAPAITAPDDETFEATATLTPLDRSDYGIARSADGDITDDAPDTFPLGDTTITWTAADASSNEMTAKQIITVVDTTAPVITLLKNTADNNRIELGTVYTEHGATATDAVDGDLTGSIDINTDNVDANAVGEYTVTYNVSDAQNNAAVQKTRTVRVTDTTAPDITAPHDQTFEATATATPLSRDDYGIARSSDGDITDDAPDTFPLGDTIITWTATDASSNEMTAKQTITVVDTTAPVITLTGANPQIIEFGEEYAELNATATDAVDGDLTGSIVIDSSAVNTDRVGEYTVAYDVTDAAGNAADTVTRTVRVIDTGKPIITLTGDNPQIIEFGTAYTELNATATDRVDGDLTGSIVIDSSAVNTDRVGDYSVTYDVTDTAGNAAEQKTRTVRVIDTGKPIITLTGDNPQTIEFGEGYTELNATATDRVDGDLTGNIVINTDNVDTSAVGEYTVTYNVTDAAGNAADTVTRTVRVTDAGKPVITLTGANPQTIEFGMAYTELNATATDLVDDDIELTGSIVIDSSAVNTDRVGDYSVTYNVTDTAGNAAAQKTRRVTITAPQIAPDNVPPTIIAPANVVAEATGPTTPVSVGQATATDRVDSMPEVTRIPLDNEFAVGVHSITWKATDASGNEATAVQTITITDATVPEITLTGANPQTIEFGEGYTELNAAATDLVDGDLTGSIVIDSSAVNTDRVGDYSVTYDVTDTAGNAAEQKTRTVRVIDNTKPMITLTGANPQTIEFGEGYAELNATATDAVDGELTGKIVIDSSAVNTDRVGDYSVTYDVTDTAGNAAEQKTRTSMTLTVRVFCSAALPAVSVTS